MAGTIIDEGAYVNILSSISWKVLGSPSLFPEMRNLTGFDKGTSRPLGILPNVPITLRGKTVHINVMVVQGPLDYNLLLGRDYIYCMRAIVSSLFRVMCFPHEGRVVKLVDQLSFPGSHISNSCTPSLSGLFMQGMSHRSPVRPLDKREWFRGYDWNPGGMHPGLLQQGNFRYRIGFREEYMTSLRHPSVWEDGD